MTGRWLLHRRLQTVVRATSRLPPLHSHLFFSSSTTTSSSSPRGGVAVKKVTRSNFEPALEDLRVRVREADFVAVDLEMTGVTSAPWRDSFEFDRSDVRYLKVKDSAEKFAVVQFGVCPFRWEPAKGVFIAHPHNFYIFPRKELPHHGPRYDFLCQTTSMDFLAKYQFDFNACIHEGISYLSRTQEAEALKYLSSSHVEGLTNSFCNLENHIEVPMSNTFDILFTERMRNKFHEWRNAIIWNPDKVCSFEERPGNGATHFQTTFFRLHPALTLNGFSSHQLKLIELIIRKHFKDLIFIRTDENGSRQSRVVYIDRKEDKESLLRELKEDVMRTVETRVNCAVGFRHVIDLLASEEKLIVGHNCFLDLAHVYNKFIGPLPSSMVDFVLGVHKLFPDIIDTKHLLNSSQALNFLMRRSSKSLSSAFSVLCPNVSLSSPSFSSNSFVKVEVQGDETGSSSFNSGAKHEAGYDAFMTGCVFAQACSHLGVKFEIHSSVTNLAINDKLKNYVNFLYPSWNSGTVVNLSTGTESPESGYKHKYPPVVFDNIVILWGFPSKFKSKDIKECICKIFGLHSITSMFFLDSTAALIQFSNGKMVNDFLTLKETLEKNDDPISVLHPLTKLLEGGKTRAAKYDTYKDICCSSASKVLFADQADTLGISWKTKLDTGGGEILEGISSSERTGDIPLYLKEVHERKDDRGRHSNSKHRISCEDILDSLCPSRSVSMKRITST